MAGFVAQIDLGKNGAKWKHGWIPLNAEAVAILNAKAEHGATLSHEQMHAMNLDTLKKHYSETIKAHGFQHAYTKKVGKAVGSHPTSLATTKAKAEAKKAGAAAPTAPAAPPVPQKVVATLKNGKLVSVASYPKVEGPALPPPPPTPEDVLKKLEADNPSIVAKVMSAEGKHIGFAVHSGAQTPGKKHAVYDLKGNHVSDVNSFTGAQHALGEKTLGKPSAMKDQAPTPEPEVSMPASHAPAPDKLAHENVGAKVTSAQHMEDAPTGTLVKYGDHQWVKAENGQWNAQGYPDDFLPSGSFGGAIVGGHVTWAGHEPPPKPAAPEKKAKPAKIEPDPEPPKHPGGMAPGWSVQSAAALDAAPTGTWITGKYDSAYRKTEDGTWARYDKNNITGEFQPPSFNYKNLPASYIVHSGANPWVWGDKGPNKEAPAGYTGPKYGVIEKNGGWAVVNHYNGQIEDTKAGKPNAAKVANDLNKAAGTLSAKQKKQAATQKAKLSAYVAGAGVHPNELNHPKVEIGAKQADLVHLRFDGSKAGELDASPAPGVAMTSNSELFGEWNSSSGAAKQNVSRQIGNRMAHHDGYDKQEKLDAAWKAMASVGAVQSYEADPVPKGFNGNAEDAFFADPQFGSTATPKIPRGTEEFRQVMREQMVAKMVQWWAQSSNDDHAVTLTLQELAAEHFGIKDVASWNSASSATRENIKKLKEDPAFRDLATSFLQSQYDTAQSAMAARGITHVTVRRGTKAGVSSSWNVGEVGATKMRPMSSWTTNASTANSFSGGKHVLQTTVPREKVIGFAGAGFGCLGEYEVVVLGGRTQAKLIK